MGYVEIVRTVTPAELTKCDDCSADELTSSGRFIYDSHGEPVIWFCYNCIQRTTKYLC